ncbi:MAG: hypothetical protein H6766_03950 [Candidatus Peribacteria bacterium]|nr:MAG: hypothetical protein H6766_03950 [Candidatus Peribacteria bacterium]
MEDFKKSHTTTHQNTKQTQTRTMRPEHINPRMHTYSSADEGRSAAHKHVIQDIANMQSFF